MQRKIILLSAAFLVSGLSAAPVQVDATTSATMNSECKITSLTATSNSFTVTWTEPFTTHGTMVLTYGVDNPPTTNKVITSVERSAHSVAISGLQQETKYYVVLNASDGGTHTPYGANGNILTGSSTAVRGEKQVYSSEISITKSKSGITISGIEVTSQGTTIKLYNARGALVVSEKIDNSRETHATFLKTSSIIPGNYFVRIVSGNKTIEQHLLIN